ncbi:hypothetical protein HZA33_04915 [Candidatus Pacearchaeota archaeon]|nr:hypothetical protein [Candidatus Pacearchaeota archaeon]
MTKKVLKNIGAFFYAILCIFSLVFAIFSILYSQLVYFYFFILSSIFSSVIVLWWGGTRKTVIKIKPEHGAFLKLIYWIGFILVLIYFYLFFFSGQDKTIFPSVSLLYTGSSPSVSLKTMLLLFGLSFMFLSLLTANLLYKKAMLASLRAKRK